MIPILFDQTEKQFTSGGLGFLADCTSCKVSQERNGVFECEFVYPISGPLYEQIQERRLIYTRDRLQSTDSLHFTLIISATG